MIGVRKIYKIRNERIREVAGVCNGVDEVSGHVKRMNVSRMVRSVRRVGRLHRLY